jgi:hypothetical protein
MNDVTDEELAQVRAKRAKWEAKEQALLQKRKVNCSSVFPRKRRLLTELEVW